MPISFIIYTRLGFLGCGPLCGTGVSSFIDEIFTPFISLIRQKKPDPHQKTLDLTERV